MSPANGPRPARFHLSCTPLVTLLDCAGELDVAQTPRLTVVLRRLERLPTPVELLLGDVSFVDSHGFEPVVSSALRRVRSAGPPMRIARQSRAVRRLLHLIGVDADRQVVDLTAWAATQFAGQPVTRAVRP